MIPCDEVGGDYYDFYLNKDKRHWYVIGDVSGHGLTSGLIMLMAQSSVSSIIKSIPDIGVKDLYIKVNYFLHDNIKYRLLSDAFMTLSFLTSDNAGNFTIAGSHIDQLLYRKNENKCEVITSKGLWAGMIPDVSNTIVEHSFKMNKNDILLLYTDGIIEAMNKQREQFDVDRLKQILIENHEKPIKQIKQAILDSIFNFMYIQDDDITLFLIKKN